MHVSVQAVKPQTNSHTCKRTNVSLVHARAYTACMNNVKIFRKINVGGAPAAAAAAPALLLLPVMLQL